MAKTAKPGTTRAPKARLRVRKMTVLELSARKTADVKGGIVQTKSTIK